MGVGPHRQSRYLLNLAARSLVSTRIVTYQLPGQRASSDIEDLILSLPEAPSHPGPPDAGIVGASPPQRGNDILRRDVHSAPANLVGPGLAANLERHLPGH